jgi:hypothetical protein
MGQSSGWVFIDRIDDEVTQMIAIKARITNGYLVSVDPVNLPEGAELEVTAHPQAVTAHQQMTEGNWPTTPEAIASLVARMDSREPLQMSDEEIEQWSRVRLDDRTWELAQSDSRDERLTKIWE